MLISCHEHILVLQTVGCIHEGTVRFAVVKVFCKLSGCIDSNELIPVNTILS